MMKVSLIIFFLLGLVYLLAPGPYTIDDFPPLPGSLKSKEDGDTWQNPNIAAYFSDYRRDFVTDFYYQNFKDQNFWGFIPPVKINHPPERAFDYIRDQQHATYLEEYLFPLRGSIFVNGYEPYDIKGKPFDRKSVPLLVEGTLYQTKTTLRYYPSSLVARVFIYFGIWLSLIWLFRLYKEALKKYE